MRHKLFTVFLAISLLGLSCGISVKAEDGGQKGDVNQDGVFDVADVVTFQKWLLAEPDIHLEDWTAVDFCEDDLLNVFDLMLMKQELINTPEPDRSVKQIDVINILQNPELPTGCETVSLAILLNHLGYPIDKLTLARDYLPKLDFYWSNGIYYGADFRTTFAGNPESSHAYGCYAPCIVTTANSFFADRGMNGKACNITGIDFDTLLTEYIAKDIPVLIWITSSNLHETKLTSIWTTPAGEKVQWVAYEHCVVLTGYDKNQDLIYVSDPLVGNTSYDYSRIKQRYIDLGQQAVYIETN